MHGRDALGVWQLLVLVGADVDERGDVAVVRAANTHRRDALGPDFKEREFWGRSHLLLQGDDVSVAGEVAREAQSQVVGFRAAVQRGQRLLRVTDSPQNTQLKDVEARSSASWREEASGDVSPIIMTPWGHGR